jgi:bifunctional UDP-N-acetylglucosamine pyrophosphorylase/glucosamine-1-phosphate N-acetyltransferase
VAEARLFAVIVLAAGEGTRMKSALPKVLHRVAGRTLVAHVLEAAATVEPEHVVVVVGHGRDQVTDHLTEIAPWAQPVTQAERLGTGHAVRIALGALTDATAGTPTAGTIVVLTGDTPLLTGATLVRLLAAHDQHGAAATVLTAELTDPTGYGRIVRDADGSVRAIVEHKDADEDVRQIREVNSGMYAFSGRHLIDALGRVTRDNVQGEEYLTDVIGILRTDGAPVAAVIADDADEIAGVNDRAQLADAARVMRDRINLRWMREGVAILDPSTTWIDTDVDLAPDVTILPQTFLLGPTSIATGAQIGPGTTLSACEVGVDARVCHTWAELAVIGDRASVGPFTYLRPGARLGVGAKAGAYVEIKNSIVGDDAKVPHLSYVGDADIGTGTNIGAATVFVNYDGQTKHRTIVGDHVRIGSDTMLVAPVTIGDGAYTAAGSVITADVPPGAMAVGRAMQRTIPGWVALKRPGSASAQAAAAAMSATTQPTIDHEGQSAGTSTAAHDHEEAP